jgi:hypothetical protein
METDQMKKTSREIAPIQKLIYNQGEDCVSEDDNNFANKPRGGVRVFKEKNVRQTPFNQVSNHMFAQYSQKV